MAPTPVATQSVVDVWRDYLSATPNQSIQDAMLYNTPSGGGTGATEAHELPYTPSTLSDWLGGVPTDTGSGEDILAHVSAITYNMVSGGVTTPLKAQAMAVTTGALPTNTYHPYDSVNGVPQYLIAASGSLTIDGYVPVTGDQILVNNEASNTHNGYYFVTYNGGGWRLDAQSWYQPSQINGSLVPVLKGTVNATTLWMLSGIVNTVGTDPIVFVRIAKPV